MLPANGTKCCLHLAYLREYAACGLKHIMDFAEHTKTDTDALPDDLQPIAQAITTISMDVLIGSFVETLTLLSEQGLQEITRAALPPNHQTEKE